MTDFLEGDRIAPRAYLIREQPDLAGRIGTVVGPLNHRVLVRWDDDDEPRQHVKSALKLVDRKNDIRRIAEDGEWSPRADERLIERPTAGLFQDTDGTAVALPGDAGFYDVEFASGLVRRQFGRTQLDAARIASQLRDRELKPVKKEGEAPPHDRVRRTVYLGPADLGPPVTAEDTLT